MRPCLSLQQIERKREEMMMTLVVFAVVFICGLLNSLLSFSPTKKTKAWLSSLFNTISPSRPSSKALSSQPRPRINEAELRRVFLTFDHNNDGAITHQELKDSLENLGLFVSDADLASMVQRLDTNGDGSLDLEEFCVLYESVNVSCRRDDGDGGGADDEKEEGQLENEELKDAFDVFDENGDGFITVEELGSVLCSLGLKRRAGRRELADDCRQMIGRVDADGDGRVSFVEFQQMMKAGDFASLC